MEPIVLLALGIVGLVIGFVSGLIGIGGGILIVPFLYFFYGHPELSGVQVPLALQTEIAHATSLFIIIPTAIWGTRSYNKAGLVEWAAAKPIGVSAAIAAVIGASFATLVPEQALRFAFGVLLVAASIQLARAREFHEERPLQLELWRTISIGVVIGLLSAMLGVGGGFVAMPLMHYLIHLDVKKLAANSLAIIMYAAVLGAITFIVTGFDTPGRPPYSLGYVHVAAALPILIGSVITVKYGARTNQKMKSRVLRRLFAVAFALMGLWLIGQNAGWIS